MDDPTIWCDYRTTLLRFRELKHERRGKYCVLSRVRLWTTESWLGFNRDKPIRPDNSSRYTEETFTDELDVIHSSNYNSADVAAATSSAIDIQRETEITKISLDNFYYAFRVMIRGLLNKYDNIDLPIE
jgi:hypothetical protein